MKSLTLLFLSLFLGLLSGQELPLKTITVILDEPSPYFERLVEGFEKELLPLAVDQYELQLKTVKPGELSVRELLLSALRDNSVDAVFTAGIRSSHLAGRLPADARTKPVIAGGIEFSDLENELISPDGYSVVPNYSFVLVPNRVQSDLATLARLSESKVIDIPLNEEIIATLRSDLAAKVAAMQKSAGLTIRIHALDSSNPTSLSWLPSSAKAVYVPILPALSDAERAGLFQKLTARKVLNLSMIGPSDLEKGAFATLATDPSQTLHRRLALNLHQALLDIDPALLPVVLRLADRLTINLAAARDIGWSPDYDTSLSATFINEDEIQNSVGTLTLEGVMARAAQVNPDIAASRASWQQAAADSQVARAGYATTLDLVGLSGISGTRDRITRAGPANGQQASLGFEVNRLLYSNQLYAQIQALDEIAAASAHDAESISLDTISDTATAYLNALEAEALYQIQKENLSLVQENLQLAKLRLDIGSRDETDSLRWLASQASTRAALIQADAARKNARVALNTQIAVPTDSHFDLTDIPLAAGETYVMQEFFDLIEKKEEFESFTKFVQALSTFRSPELSSFNRTLLAQGISLQERENRFLRPDINLSGSVTHLLQDSNLTSSDSQTDWTVGIGFTIPFLERELREAETAQIEASIAALNAQKLGAAYLIEQRALAASYGLASSHPSMRLSRQARTAAEKNYEMIREQYRLGSVDVVTLLDSQTNLLTQRQAEASSLYDYLRDTVSLQRAIAWFEFAKTPAEKKTLIQQFENYRRTGSLFLKVLPAK